MAMVLMILLSANMGIVGVAAQGVNCYDNCNTGCAGLPSKEYLKCDKKCHKRCGDDSYALNFDNGGGDGRDDDGLLRNFSSRCHIV
uniref:Uncharacterized protein n=1 Tax=Solanum tuberosum TaxID=4113 RepID=M1CWW8_SOLTU